MHYINWDEGYNNNWTENVTFVAIYFKYAYNYMYLVFWELLLSDPVLLEQGFCLLFWKRKSGPGCELGHATYCKSRLVFR